MKSLAILGASGHGRVVADAAERAGWDQIFFFDDAWPSLEQNLSWPVIGTRSDMVSRVDEFDGVIVAIGNNVVRRECLLQLFADRAPVVSIIHPDAVASRHARLGLGSVMFAGAILNAGATVGFGGILNTGCSVDHDCVLGDGVHLSPGARLSGGVVVGGLSWIGVGACVRQQISIGQQVIVGAGAVVVADVPDGLTVVGNPARRLG